METVVIQKALDIHKPMELLALVNSELFGGHGVKDFEVVEVLFNNQQVCMVKLNDEKTATPYALINLATQRCTYNNLDYAVSNLEAAPVPKSLSERAYNFASRGHTNINQFYDGKPYMFHVDMALDVARQFIHLIPAEDREYVLAGIALHDLPEDSHAVTYNTVKDEFGEPVADFSFALANEKGKTRDERANPKYYREMREVLHAVFGKLCDRIANIKHGINTGGSMLRRYRKEHAKFVSETYDPKYQEMFDHLDQLLAQ